VSSSALGPVMVDVQGTALDPGEREMLAHPLVGGVILFSRNYESPAQLKALTAAIRSVREPHLLIAVDQEGGRVQRFREGFTRLPAMAQLGRLCERDPAGALEAARNVGRILAHELSAHGLDFSFVPVLDIDFGRSAVIGERAFSSDPARVATLAGELMLGLGLGGVAAVGKHFPGHGFVEADSHVAVPHDPRPLSDLEAADLVPYRRLIPLGLAGVMPAHVIYPAIDPRPAGFSAFWLKRVLRERLGFDGLIFSDDLSMEGACVAGGVVERGMAALEAGCDMVLVCNQPDAAMRLLGGLEAGPMDAHRADRMRARAGADSGLDAALAQERVRTLLGQEP
jgi:beta-N-acetylhexosaminidase